jgi:hypothetical protein
MGWKKPNQAEFVIYSLDLMDQECAIHRRLAEFCEVRASFLARYALFTRSVAGAGGTDHP